MTKEERLFLTDAIETIQEESIKEFSWTVAENLPEYIWKVGASSTGKYHPKYTLGTLGLMKHQVAVLRFLNYFLELDQYSNVIPDHQKDLMRVAALFHDGLKSGSQEDYQKSPWTKHDHPLLMKDFIQGLPGKISTEDKKFIGDLIGSHMGQWNTSGNSSVVLPTPQSLPQELIHLADYLASRKDLEVLWDSWNLPMDLESHKISFGKHSGKTWIEVKSEDPSYLAWAKNNIKEGPEVRYLSEITL